MALPWTPQYLDPALWLDASAAGTLIVSEERVETWQDRSRHQRHFQQPILERRPLSVDSGVFFDNPVGVRTGINSARYMEYPSQILHRPPFEAYFVADSINQPTFGMGGPVISSSRSASQYVFFGPIGENTVRAQYANSSVHQASTNLDWTDGKRHMARGVWQRWSREIMPNGVASGVVHNAVVNEIPDGGVTLLGLNFIPTAPTESDALRGAIREVIVFDRILTTLERQFMDGYLWHKWDLASMAIGWTLSGHPYEHNPPTVPFQVKGTIRDINNAPCQRTICAMSRPIDGSPPKILTHTRSDAVTGAYDMAFFNDAEITRVVISENDDPPLNDIVDRVIPGMPE